MHPLRRQRLITVLVIVGLSSIAIGLVMYAMRENMNLFFPPRDLLNGKAPVGKAVRVGGFVVENSVQRTEGSLEVQFAVTDGEQAVTVVYTGILPDLFGEGQAALAKGVWDGKEFQATEVLAKHDENYTPPEVVDSMKKMGMPKPAGHQ